MSDTPETDAITSVGLENADRECVPAEFARRLERERDEAREQNAKLVSIAEIAIDELAWFHDIIAHKLWNKLEQLKKETK